MMRERQTSKTKSFLEREAMIHQQFSEKTKDEFKRKPYEHMKGIKNEMDNQKRESDKRI